MSRLYTTEHEPEIRRLMPEEYRVDLSHGAMSCYEVERRVKLQIRFRRDYYAKMGIGTRNIQDWENAPQKQSVVKKPKKRGYLNKNQRKRLFERDQYFCQLCGLNLRFNPELRVIDHRIPLAKGGSNQQTNLWLLCRDCDTEKGDMYLWDYLKKKTG